MSTVTLLLIALGVSADAFAVSIGKGLTMPRARRRDALAIALTFGAFQGLMPLIGWAVGRQLRDDITSVDHWIAFGLLALIGGRMIWEALHPHDDEVVPSGIRTRELLVLGLATSIDALAVGVGFAFLAVDIVPAVAAIGVVTFVVSYAGVGVGARAGRRFRAPAEVAGGIILIGIGTRILLDHLGVI